MADPRSVEAIAQELSLGSASPARKLIADAIDAGFSGPDIVALYRQGAAVDRNVGGARVLRQALEGRARSAKQADVAEGAALVGLRPAQVGGTEGAVEGQDPAAMMAPTLRQIVAAAASNPPDPNTYGEDEGGIAGWMTDMSEWSDLMAKLAEQESTQALRAAGVMKMPDGTYAGIEDAASSPDPNIRQWAERTLATQEIELAGLLDSMGLAEFNSYRSGVQAENQRRTADFAARMDEFGAKMDYDQKNVTRAASDVARSVAGMQESRARAADATQAQIDAAPWQTKGGKTDFSMGELGGGIDALARQAGIRPGQPLIRFPGSQNIDPSRLMQQGDAAMGVSGPLPLIPQLQTQYGDVPQAPGLAAIPQGAPVSQAAPLIQALLASLRQRPQQAVPIGSAHPADFGA